jgi:hypothetical protein
MKIFKEAFTGAGLDYYSPHTFRKTIVNLGEKLCKNPEEFKAWSQNIGHESPLTTFISYGYVDVHRQGDIIKNIGNSEKENPFDIIMQRLDKMEAR